MVSKRYVTLICSEKNDIIERLKRICLSDTDDHSSNAHINDFEAYKSNLILSWEAESAAIAETELNNLEMVKLEQSINELRDRIASKCVILEELGSKYSSCRTISRGCS